MSRRGVLQAAGVGGVATVAGIGGFRTYLMGPSVYEPPAHSMDGKVVVITGGTAGLGLESAKRLAAAGATVVLTSRTATKGNVAVSKVQEYLADRGVTNENVYSSVLDLDDLSSVKAFPQALSRLPVWKSNDAKIDVLMNNAGVMAIPDKQLTKDGIERTFQSNHLGHFVLTAKLSDKLSDKARVINLSSSAHSIPSKGLDLDNLNGEKEYGPLLSYGYSKLSNILFTKELQQRATEAGKGWTVVANHPGVVETDLFRHFLSEEKQKQFETEGPQGLDKIIVNFVSLFLRPVERGANTQIYLASVDDNTMARLGGKYVVDMKVTKPSKNTQDEDAAKGLWDISEKLSGIKFGL